MKVLSVVGARPNFMKIAPFIRAVERNNASGSLHIEHVLVHTGQHFDSNMSDTFFSNLKIPVPDHHLGIGSGSHAYQVGQTMIEFEKVLLEERPDWVVVVGDVNATCACSLTAKKHQVLVAHIEAGLRSHDWAMPEEINRVVTDRLSDLLFTTCRFADENLRKEGVPDERIARVGNVMIDTLEHMRGQSGDRIPMDIVRENTFAGDGARGSTEHVAWTSEMNENEYGVLTLHRPSNVDDPQTLARLTAMVKEIAQDLPLVFPLHPRTMDRLKSFGLWEDVRSDSNIMLTQPLGYIDMLALNMKARMVLTDSGGVQEECCVLGTPCITLRWNTERPVTLVDHGGTNRLVGNDPYQVLRAFGEAMTTPRRPARPEMWDGNTADRIVSCLVSATKNENVASTES
jgi:UDP-N-acetylglucosamine 2-epimerase (non-hydrolysing)